MDLLAELRAHVGELPEELASRIEMELEAARVRWPDGPDPDASLASMMAPNLASLPAIDDLYLAWWCRSGAPAAITAFEARFEEDVRVAAARFRDVPADELRQILRVKLFVGGQESRPRIGDYAGKGSLQGWVRVTALRCFVDAVRASGGRQREQPLDEAGLFGPADPQGDVIHSELAAAVKKAFAEGVSRLAPRQRVFLRHAYVDRHTLDQIATHYAVHRATVARVLAAAREQLIAETRAAVAAALDLDPERLTTVIRALDSNFDLSLTRVLDAPSL
jgi:RNA polymerase sigma-70 factor (ECF subfamily)